MLSKYFEAAMRRACFQEIEDGTWVGEIPGFDGLWGHGADCLASASDLRSALEDWVLVGAYLHNPLPVIDGIDLNVRKVA
jgi:predicted RNase H-like HicB family nuclease